MAAGPRGPTPRRWAPARPRAALGASTTRGPDPAPTQHQLMVELAAGAQGSTHIPPTATAIHAQVKLTHSCHDANLGRFLGVLSLSERATHYSWSIYSIC